LSILDQIISHGSRAVIVVASNPVDILTYAAIKHLGWPKARVLGSGTVLDSSRFRYLISQHCGVDVGNVHAYFLGEHGDSEFPAWSMTHIAGVSIDDYCPFCKKCNGWQLERDKIAQTVKDSAYHIINYKGATYFGIGMALVRIVGSILQDQRSVLPVSTYLDGEYGIKDVCLGVPCVVGQGGVREIVEAPLFQDEEKALFKSASFLQGILKQLDL
jgi:L-lactate dehydrogenase